VVRTAALVGTYPPTECGLATFTANLRSAVAAPGRGWDGVVVRVVDERAASAPEVVAQWVVGDEGTRRRGAAAASRCDVVLLQHEYGIYGGPDGDEVLPFIDALRTPLVAVLHTLLADPSPHQRAVLSAVIERSSHLVVLSHSALERLVTVHGVHERRVTVIPHGASDEPGTAPAPLPHPNILTWGLLGPGTGIEHVIDALALLDDEDRSPTYVVAGDTHPKVRLHEGDRYRRSLAARARALDIDDRVRFLTGYRGWDALRSLVRAADVVVLPYDSTDQVTSGALVEALVLGKPVIATAFPHAVELLSGGAGIVVPQGDPRRLADAISSVLWDRERLAAMSAEALRISREFRWSAVGAALRRLLDAVVEGRAAA
jgi:glycosyltransferase involved in cell wall biosynthesis